MGRWTQYDEDSARLPDGMRRVGYDTDTGRYTFNDRNGVLYQSEPGSSYGILTPVHRAVDTGVQRERSNTIMPSSPEEQKTISGEFNVNTFEDFLPPEAIAYLSSPSQKTPSGLRRLPDVVRKVKAMRTVVSKMRNPRSDRTLHRTKSLPPLPPSPTLSQTTQTLPRLTHKRKGYSQLPEARDGSGVEPKARALFRSLTVFARSSVGFSKRRSPQPRPGGTSSRVSTFSTTSTITPMETF